MLNAALAAVVNAFSGMFLQCGTVNDNDENARRAACASDGGSDGGSTGRAPRLDNSVPACVVTHVNDGTRHYAVLRDSKYVRVPTCNVGWFAVVGLLALRGG